MRTGAKVLASLVLTLALLSSCVPTGAGQKAGDNNGFIKNPAAPMGMIKVNVTDAPRADEITHIRVTVTGIKIHRAGIAELDVDELSSSPTPPAEGKWISIPISSGNTFDLMEIMGISDLLALGQVEAGKYTQVRLEIDKIEVDTSDQTGLKATLGDKEIKFVRPFEVVAGQTTSLLFDFDAAKTINISGQGKITAKPVVKLTLQQGKSHDIVSLDGSITAIESASGTVSVLPTGKTEVAVLDVSPAAKITLNGDRAGFTDLKVGQLVTAAYFVDNFEVTKLDARTTPP